MNTGRAWTWIGLVIMAAVIVGFGFLFVKLGLDDGDRISSGIAAAASVIGLVAMGIGALKAEAASGRPAHGIPPTGPVVQVVGDVVGNIDVKNLPVRQVKNKTNAVVAIIALTAICTPLTTRIALEPAVESLPTCNDVGVFVNGYDRVPKDRQAWVDAYNAAGGKKVLGCPIANSRDGYVHEWERGASQDLVVDQEGRQHRSRLMSLDGRNVIAMTGAFYEDYTFPLKELAARELGYPTTNPFPCGEALVVLLEKGAYAPGALVSTPTRRYAWLPSPIWEAYQALGGPLGPLGRPLNSLLRDISGEIRFEDGSAISLIDGRVTVDQVPAGSPMTTTGVAISPPCPPR